MLRLRCDDAGAQVQLGLKYGAEPHEVPGLLAAAKRLGLRVVGVSFHVGSGVRNYGVYSEAVRRARAAFDAAAELGFTEMSLLDVGGGFVAPHAPAPAAAFVASAAAINEALASYFPEAEWPGLQIISEPGRYFAESSATLVAPVYSIRNRTTAEGGEVARRDYWVTDGGWPGGGGVMRGGLGLGGGGGRRGRAAQLPGDRPRRGNCTPRPLLLRPPPRRPTTPPHPAPPPAPPPPPGLYGSFNCMLYDDQHPSFRVLRSPRLPPPPPGADAGGHPSAVWGPTCDSADCLYKEVTVPELRIGDCLVFSNAGGWGGCLLGGEGAGAALRGAGLCVARLRRGARAAPTARDRGAPLPRRTPHVRLQGGEDPTPLPRMTDRCSLGSPSPPKRCLHRRGRVRLQRHQLLRPQQAIHRQPRARADGVSQSTPPLARRAPTA